jgi:hypothetical protein
MLQFLEHFSNYSLARIAIKLLKIDIFISILKITGDVPVGRLAELFSGSLLPFFFALFPPFPL